MSAFELKPDFARTALGDRENAVGSRRIEGSSERVQAALAALLARYSGETEITLPIEASAPLFFDLSGDPSFAEILGRARKDLKLSSSGSLDFSFTAGLVFCHYDARLYRASTIEALLEHLDLLLQDIARHPDRKLSEFKFLSASQEQRLLVEWNHTGAEYPREQCIHELLELQAARTPDAIAAQFQGQTLTYAELEARANRLAHGLAGRGAGHGALVGISLDRSLEMLTAVLAVLKTGAGFLPLDPAFPKARLEFMAKDAAIRILITSKTLTGHIATDAVEVIVEESQSNVSPLAARPAGGAGGSESTAYVLYTSGSTGEPKGVEVTHRSVMNLLYGIQKHVELQAGESLLAVTTLSFDIAMLELFLPLLAGGRVVIASRTQAADPQALRALLQQAKPALMQATPITWRLLVESGWTGSPGLKMLIGGERVTRDIADALLERGSALWNVYGPTETSIWSTICRMERDGQPVSIGRPIANTTLYVLDENRNPAPAGVCGELYIGGDGVARGYLNRPTLTAERFVENPFGQGRLYRTGDVVRYLPDGRLEILGRNDAQVKVRGFRIELGDVESALLACPAVGAAAVIVREGEDGESALAAYFVPATGARAGVDVAAIRSALAGRLPDYMVPVALVEMVALPRTPNGKVDRVALANGSGGPLPYGRGSEAARGMTEESSETGGAWRGIAGGGWGSGGVRNGQSLETILIGIWESTLGVRPILPSDNFFDLGGHSILAARIFARMEKALGQSMPLATLFQAPTIEKLAAVIRKSEWKPLWSPLVPIRPAGRKTPLFFVHPIGGNVVNFSGFCSHFEADQPIYALQARGLNGEEAPHTSVEEMAADYIQSIRGVQPEGPYFIGGFSAGGIAALEMARQLQAAGQPVGMLALLDTEIVTTSPTQAAGAARPGDWWRMARINLRYASRMKLLEYVGKKSFNLRMRLKLFAWSARERLGLSIDPAALNAEEGFLLACKRYVPQPYAGNATLFRAGDGAEYLDPKLGWNGIILGHLDIQEVSGDHDTILQEPHIKMLAGLLEQCLEKAAEAGVQPPSTHPSAGAETRPGGLTSAVLGKS